MKTKTTQQLIGEYDPSPQPKPPLSPIDIFLFPLNSSGIIHIFSIWLFFLIWNYLGRFISSLTLGFGGIITMIISFLIIGYLLMFFADCIRTTSKGEKNPPEICMPELDDLRSQFFCIVGEGSFAIFGVMATDKPFPDDEMIKIR